MDHSGLLDHATAGAKWLRVDASNVDPVVAILGVDMSTPALLVGAVAFCALFATFATRHL